MPGRSFVNSKDREAVESFARETGDLNSLSEVDKLVIATGLTLARDKDEFKHVLRKPKDLQEFRPKSFKSFYENEEEDDFWNEDDDAG